jgi:hypothetical protein
MRRSHVGAASQTTKPLDLEDALEEFGPSVSSCLESRRDSCGGAVFGRGKTITKPFRAKVYSESRAFRTKGTL